MDYKQLVNQKHPYQPSKDLQLIEVVNLKGKKILIEQQTEQAFQKLQKELNQQKIYIGLIDAYRTLEDQANIWQDYQNKFGLSYTKKYVAPVGYSEHHTGLAVDIGLIVDGILYEELKEIETRKEELQTIFTHLSKHGFILRYPKGKEKITGYQYEPWHFRYVGPSLAKELEAKCITLDEYYS